MSRFSLLFGLEANNTLKVTVLRRSYYCWRKLLLLAVKDICAINTFEKLLNILFSEVYC